MTSESHPRHLVGNRVRDRQGPGLPRRGEALTLASDTGSNYQSLTSTAKLLDISGLNDTEYHPWPGAQGHGLEVRAMGGRLKEPRNFFGGLPFIAG